MRVENGRGIGWQRKDMAKQKGQGITMFATKKLGKNIGHKEQNRGRGEREFRKNKVTKINEITK